MLNKLAPQYQIAKTKKPEDQTNAAAAQLIYVNCERKKTHTIPAKTKPVQTSKYPEKHEVIIAKQQGYTLGKKKKRGGKPNNVTKDVPKTHLLQDKKERGKTSRKVEKVSRNQR